MSANSLSFASAVFPKFEALQLSKDKKLPDIFKHF